ncbi:hypothetical protein R3P38DRAFT_2979720, partial [Favolaschia claudopus]
MCLVNGHPAKTLYASQPASQMSRHYARSIGFKFSAAITTLFVSVSVAAFIADGPPTLFTHTPFSVGLTDNAFADIVLGHDWLAICRAAAEHGNTVFAAYTYESRLNIPHDVLMPPLRDEVRTPETPSQPPQGEPALQVELLEPSALQAELLEPPALQVELEPPALQVESMNELSVFQTESLNELSAAQTEIMNQSVATSEPLNKSSELDPQFVL